MCYCRRTQLERADNGSVSFLLPADQFPVAPERTPAFLLRLQSPAARSSQSAAAFMTLSPEDISALVLLRLKRSAELSLKVWTERPILYYSNYIHTFLCGP